MKNHYRRIGPPFKHLWEHGKLCEFTVRICTTKALYDEIETALVSANDPTKQKVFSMVLVSTKETRS